ncbi:C40 family peptidase [Clostridium sp. Marseille-P299]|uniref:C40 family peptidase n=1 Tax=Clostridium sp. Marseille-P299 TaxID=1805477 RepID=UPI000834613B|nr:C40 family peptidase [Clostridium sp. Marseille-P299]
MRNKKLMKASLGLAALCLLMINSTEVKAEEIAKEETAVAGMSKLLEDYYSERLSETGISISNVTTPFYVNGERLEPVNTGISPLEGYAFSNTQDYVNIRRKASTKSKIIGKLYRGSAAEVIKVGKVWTLVKSGSVEGYIKSEYLLYGADAETLAKENSIIYAKATCVTLNVRMGQGTDYKILTQIPQGERFEVKNTYDDWFEIILDIDDNTGEEVTGFISKDYADLEYEFNEAVSIEEEQAAIEEARREEEERLALLAQQQAANRPSSNSSSSSSSSNSGSSGSSSSSSSSNSSSSGTSSNSSSSNNSSSGSSNSNGNSSSSSSTTSTKGSEIANYALKFVGNPYKWGGTSLTNGADCSGFVYAVYKNFGYTLPRVSRDQARYGTSVNLSTSSLQPGDLIFYGTSSGYVNHVAMYVGNGKVVHASNYREGIKISTWNYRTPLGARRILN